ASLVGNVNSAGTTKFDTITLNAIPEPSTSTLLVLSALSLLAASRKKRSANHV
ncbi:PEP-CTERM sorting domain-containing protein, partial [bacterium]|nr:PEP-CTERM sorting domain-containing protein [bacterium]